MKKVIIVLLSLVTIGSVSAQMADEARLKDVDRQNALGVQPAATSFSLLDLSRVRWSHSYSVSYFSGGGYSESVGFLKSTMFYDFSSKISLALNLGVAHNAGAIWGDGRNNASLLPGFQLDYHPSEKFRMSIGFQTYDGFASPYYLSRNPYGYRYLGY